MQLMDKSMKLEELQKDINYIDTEYIGASQVVVMRMSFAFIVNYSYLVYDSVTNRSVIVDPAWDMEKIDMVLASTRTKLSGVLLTHSHPDHIHLAEPLAEKYDCPIWMSHEEIANSGFKAQQLIGVDMLPLEVGQMQIQPILTPGHTPGSTCYLIGNNLFTGDTLFAEGCGICPDVQAARAMFASLKLLKSRIKPETNVFPGHSYGKPPGQKFSNLLMENMYLQFRNENDFAVFRLRRGQKHSAFANFF
jgi:hydroxyacylglutathione hydrolase